MVFPRAFFRLHRDPRVFARLRPSPGLAHRSDVVDDPDTLGSHPHDHPRRVSPPIVVRPGDSHLPACSWIRVVGKTAHLPGYPGPVGILGGWILCRRSCRSFGPAENLGRIGESVVPQPAGCTGGPGSACRFRGLLGEVFRPRTAGPNLR